MLRETNSSDRVVRRSPGVVLVRHETTNLSCDDRQWSVNLWVPGRSKLWFVVEYELDRRGLPHRF